MSARNKIDNAIQQAKARIPYVFGKTDGDDKPTIIMTEEDLDRLLEGFGLDVTYSQELRDALFQANN